QAAAPPLRAAPPAPTRGHAVSERGRLPRTPTLAGAYFWPLPLALFCGAAFSVTLIFAPAARILPFGFLWLTTFPFLVVAPFIFFTLPVLQPWPRRTFFAACSERPVTFGTMQPL